MSVTKITQSDFNSLVSSADAGVQVFRFWAPWCSPCMMMKPMYEEAAKKIGDTALLGEINVDEEQALSAKHGIRSIPTVVFYKDGQEAGRFSGVMTASNIAEIVEKLRTAEE